MDPTKIGVTLNWDSPKNGSKVQSFLGPAGSITRDLMMVFLLFNPRTKLTQHITIN